MDDYTARMKQIELETKRLVAQGADHFQLFWTDDDARRHMRNLLDFMEPKTHAVIIDMGAGIGGTAKAMKVFRHDLTFVLVNNDAYQLSISEGGLPWSGDLHCTRLPPRCADVVLFSYSIGYGTLPCSLAEAQRLLKPNGTLMVWDMVGFSPDLYDQLNYLVWSWETWQEVAERIGFTLDRFLQLEPLGYSTKEFDRLCPEFAPFFHEKIEPHVKPFAAKWMRRA